jgi:hypothetical protein
VRPNLQDIHAVCVNSVNIDALDLYKASIILVATLSALFGLALSFLIYTQTQNFMMNKTSSMRFGRYLRNGSGKGEGFKSGFNQAGNSLYQHILNHEDDEDQYASTPIIARKTITISSEESYML